MALNKKKNTVFFIILLVTIVTGFIFTFLQGGDSSDKITETDHLYNVPRDMTVNESSVFLYFCDRKRPYLVAEERVLSHSENPVLFAKTIIEALIKGSHNGMMRSIPAGTILKALYITNEKTAYADFSREIRDGHPGGSQMEYLSVYSIINSLALNIPEIEKVKILIEGQEIETLAGHIDVRTSLSANMLLVR